MQVPRPFGRIAGPVARQVDLARRRGRVEVRVLARFRPEVDRTVSSERSRQGIPRGRTASRQDVARIERVDGHEVGILRVGVGERTAQAEKVRRPGEHLELEPFAFRLRSVLVIATYRRVYHVLLESTAGTAMASVSWSYPQHALLALDRAAAAASSAETAGGVSLETLNFGYTIEGDDPPWRPLRAFDDGAQVFIEFPPGFAQGEAPPLFVSGADGTPELVNSVREGEFHVGQAVAGQPRDVSRRARGGTGIDPRDRAQMRRRA